MIRLRLAVSQTFRSLKVRNFRLFFLGQVVSQLGVWTSRTAQTLLLLDLTGSGLQLGLLAACQYGPVLILGAWAGTIADRFDKRRLLLIVQAAAIVPSFLLGLVLLADVVVVPLVFSLALVQGVLTAFDNPTRRAYVIELIESDNVSNAVSLTSTVITSAQMIGPVIAGVLALSVGYAWCFFFDSASYVAAIAALLLIRASDTATPRPEASGKGLIRAGLRYVSSERDLFIPMGMMAAIGAFGFNFPVSTPLLVTRSLGGDEQSYTFLLSLIGCGSAVGALATARRSRVPTRHLVIAATAFGTAIFLLSVAPNLGIAFVIAPAMGLAGAFFFTSLASIVQLVAAPEFRGRVMALQAMVFIGSMPIGGLIIGWTADNLGGRAGVTLGAIACWAAAFWGWSTWRRPITEPDERPTMITQRPTV